MKLYAPHLKPDEEPITTIAEYMAARRQYEQARERRINFEGGWGPELKRLSEQARHILCEFRRRLPYVLVSQCPFCETSIWQRARIFSLQDGYWYLEYDDGRDVYEESLCPHLFCVDGALNLHGRQPTEATGSSNPNKKITMAAEAPFVKPRVLNLPTMVAIVHSLPVADRYTAYPVVYFCTQHPDQMEFCIPWARVQYVDHFRGYGDVALSGERSDAQVYDLAEWIEQKKVFWLSKDESHIIRGDASTFPYSDLPGRRHPYYIKDGQVYDLPDPEQGEAITSIETFI